MKHIHYLNKISPKGTALWTEDYTVAEDINQADALLVRSANMHEMVLPENLLAIARAGAGVNNIPLTSCADQGIVVFNTPGANANSVMELALCPDPAEVRRLPEFRERNRTCPPRIDARPAEFPQHLSVSSTGKSEEVPAFIIYHFFSLFHNTVCPLSAHILSKDFKQNNFC